ncbi:unnamed protein product [Arctogadus glacialis]
MEMYIVPKDTRPAFTLEGKAREATASREDGGAGGASSLSGDTGPDWLSHGPATLPLSQGDDAPPGPWQSESLLAESWSTMGDPDPEDAKSLDSSEGGVLLPGEENHSSPSDMVHLEREDEDEEEEEEEEAEEVETAGGEEEDDMQSSVLSMLGGEQELEELRREQEQQEEEEEEQPRHLSSQLLVAAAEDALRAGGRHHLSGREASTATAPMPIFKLQPPSSTSTPVPSITSPSSSSSSSSCRPSEVVEEQRYSRQELLPPPVLVPVVAGQPAAAAAAESRAPDQPRFSQVPLGSVGEEKVPGHGTPQNPTTEAPAAAAAAAAAEPAGSTDLPMMLCGGAVLVAVVGVVAYGALAYGRK